MNVDTLLISEEKYAWFRSCLFAYRAGSCTAFSCITIRSSEKKSIVSILRKGTKMWFTCNDLNCGGAVSKCGSLCMKKDYEFSDHKPRCRSVFLKQWLSKWINYFQRSYSHVFSHFASSGCCMHHVFWHLKSVHFFSQNVFVSSVVRIK
jgi:hypothetical protein